MPLQATSGAASYDAFGGGVAAVPNYIEDVFSTYLYTGNNTSQTINNGIDLSTKGGLVWIKARTDPTNNVLDDTARGVKKDLYSNTTSAQVGIYNTVTAFNTNGFSIGNDGAVNGGVNFASWTFRKQPKFFDVVTWTGTGTVNHNLGSTPGFWVYKNTGATGNWFALARKSDGTYEALYLNQTSATVYTGANAAAVGLTSTTFDPSLVFGSAAGQSYVGYAFAHNAGGFGLTSTDNVISCGSYTSSTSSQTINLGYEPQFLLIKTASAIADWLIWDTVRGMSLTSDARLDPNNSNAEVKYSTGYFSPTATGFTDNGGFVGDNGHTMIYIAIRRGPMKVPTSGTSVFAPVAYTGDGTGSRVVTSSVTSDFSFLRTRGAAGAQPIFQSRLQGSGANLNTTSTGAEVNSGTSYTAQFDQQTGIRLGTSDTGSGDYNQNSINFINWVAQRAPSFMDVVCYPGTFSAKTVNHNLGVVPELIIFKKRNGVERWPVYSAYIGANQALTLSAEWAAGNDNICNNTRPTSTVFSVSGSNEPLVNEAGYNYVAYLFATCAGVSKVGSYTGTGTTLQVNCGFTGGARFVMIKRTDSTGDWYVWDSARGIVSGNDPYLLLNSTAAEVTNTDYVDTYSAGFEISSTAPAAINASGGTFIFLAIA